MQKRRIKWRRIDELRPYESNPVHHSKTQIALIAQSIQEFGFTNPLLIDEEDFVVAGHARLLGATELGMREVPTILLTDLTEEQIRAYRIADNQLAKLAQWDDGLLSAELNALKDMNYRLDFTGFGVDELARILPGTDASLEDEDAPAAPSRPKTRRGDIYDLGDHVLMCGDAEDQADVLALLGTARPHLMVTDPPYGVNYDANWRSEKVNARPVERDVILNDDRAGWEKAWTLFPGDVAYVWHSGLESGPVQASLVVAGFKMRAHIIWNKNQIAISRGHYHWKHEPCWYAVRDGGTAHWSGSRKQGTVWDIANLGRLEFRHPNQKPVECMRRPIINNSKPGDGVYDPFGGTGTTLMACEMTGRRSYTMELDPRFCDVIVARWENRTGFEAGKERAVDGHKKAKGKKAHGTTPKARGKKTGKKASKSKA